MSRWSKTLSLACLLVCLCIGVYAFSVELDLISAEYPSQGEVIYLPSTHILQLASLGNRAAVADLLWVRSIMYFGEHLTTDRKYMWLSTYINAIVKLDPLFKKVYKWAGVVTMYNTFRLTRILPENVRLSTRFLKEGYQRFPDDWEFPFMIGANYYFELGDKAEGLPYFRESSALSGAPYWLATMVATMMTREGEREMAIAHLRRVFAVTDNPKIRQRIAGRIRLLAGKRAEDSLKSRFEILAEEWRRDWPYIPFDLFLRLRRVTL